MFIINLLEKLGLDLPMGDVHAIIGGDGLPHIGGTLLLVGVKQAINEISCWRADTKPFISHKRVSLPHAPKHMQSDNHKSVWHRPIC